MTRRQILFYRSQVVPLYRDRLPANVPDDQLKRLLAAVRKAKAGGEK